MAVVFVNNWNSAQLAPLPKFTVANPTNIGVFIRPVNWNSAHARPIPFYVSSFPVFTPSGGVWLPPKPLPGSSGGGGGGGGTVGYAT